MKRLTLALCVMAAMVLSQPVHAQLFAADIDSDDIYLIDPVAGTTTLIGNSGENISFSGLALDTSTDTLYGSDVQNPSGGSFGLASIDQLTGVATYIGDHVNSNNIWGLAYLPGTDTLVGADNSIGLATINRATGESTLIGNFDEDAVFVCGLTYDTDSGVLYGVDAFSDGASTLYTIDPTTGAATAVGALGINLDASNVRCGLAWNPVDNKIYAGAYNGSIYEVNTATGEATFVYDAGVNIDALTAVSSTNETLRVKVTKTFSDGSTDEIDVMLTCNSGLPLEQSFTIAGGDPDGVTFVVTDIPESGATCEVTESGAPAGYTTELNGGAGCEWEDVTFGYFICEITNEANPATYTVFKDFTVQRAGGDVVIAEADITIECDSEIDGGFDEEGTWFLTGTLSDGETLVATVDTTEGPATCSATEEITQSGVEQSASGCGPTELPAGGSHTCTFTNTVFFEGIPTLSQYGLAILVLLTLGVGFVGLRRFV